MVTMKLFTRLQAILLFVLCLALCPAFSHAQSNLRGGNIDGGTFGGSDDMAYVQRLRETGASAVRLFFLNENAATNTEAQYRAWLENTVYPRMAELVDLFANQMGMHVLLS